MQIIKLALALGCLSICSVSDAAPAPALHSLSDLENGLHAHLGRTFGNGHMIDAAIDPRLRLKKCPEPVKFENKNMRYTVASCSSLNWRISIPLRGVDRSTASEFVRSIMVERGDPVMFIIRRNGFAISRQMIAQKSGALGDIVPVRSNRRASPIMAEITGKAMVTLPNF